MGLPSYVVVTQFQGTCDMVFLRVILYGAHGLGIACGGLALHRRTFPLVAHEEIEFHAAVFMEVIQSAAHLSQDVGHEILLVGPVVAEQVALQYARLPEDKSHL